MGLEVMAQLLRDEEERIFGKRVALIKQVVQQHDEGLILHSELLSTLRELLG